MRRTGKALCDRHPLPIGVTGDREVRVVDVADLSDDLAKLKGFAADAIIVGFVAVTPDIARGCREL